ncbi:MAG: helix-turn-helix domain-containing protein [Bacteriovoracia bacterium]
MLPLLYLWNSKAMYLGPSFETGEHSHNAIQIVVGLRGNVKILIDGEWKVGNFFIIPPNVRHQTVLLGMVAMMYADSEDVRFDSKGPRNTSISNDIKEKLLEIYYSPAEVQSAESIYDEVLKQVGFSRSKSGSIDGRVLKCLEYIDAHYFESLTMERICIDLQIPESTLSHLFSKEVGIPFRRYLIWKRLKNAVYYFLNTSCSLTDAALEAGFSDQPHFTKCFKEIFGVNPSYVFGKKLKLLNMVNRLKL